MKIAIPVFGDRVSPRFDCASEMRVVTIQQDAIAEQTQMDVARWSAQDRIERLIDLGVNVVICGGIDRWSATSLMDKGIQLYGWVSGTVEASLDSLRRGELAAHLEVIPPENCRRTRRCGRRRGRGKQR